MSHSFQLSFFRQFRLLLSKLHSTFHRELFEQKNESKKILIFCLYWISDFDWKDFGSCCQNSKLRFTFPGENCGRKTVFEKVRKVSFFRMHMKKLPTSQEEQLEQLFGTFRKKTFYVLTENFLADVVKIGFQVFSGTFWAEFVNRNNSKIYSFSALSAYQCWLAFRKCFPSFQTDKHLEWLFSKKQLSKY